MSALKQSNGVISNFLREYVKTNATITKEYLRAKMYKMYKLRLRDSVIEKRCKMFNIKIV